jgi:hypothetical protein
VSSQKLLTVPRLTWLLITAALILTLNAAAINFPLYVLLSLAKALVLVFVMFIYGFLVPRLAYYNRKEAPFDFTTAFAVGLIVTTLFFYLVSLFKILFPWLIVLYYLAPLPIFFFIIKKQEPGFIRTFTVFFKRPPVEYLVFLFPLIYALLPPSFYDTLAYHLGIPNLYLQNTGFIGTPQLFYANTFIYYEISLLPAVFAGDLVPRLFHFFMGVIFILSVLDFAVDYFKITKRTILLLTIISMPMMVFLLTTVKNDLPSGLLILLGVSCFLKNKKYLSALFWGFSLGVKYTNILPLVLFLILYFIKEKRIPIKQMVIFGLIIVGILLPLLVKNYTYTGNPLFPFFHGYFDNKLPYWDATRSTLLERDAKKLFYSFTDVIKFPYTLSFSELGSGGIVGPLFLIFLPFLVVKKEKRLFLLLFSLLILLVGANFKLSIRVWTIAFIFLSIYVVIAYEFLTYQIMKYLFFIIIGLNVVNAFGLQEFLYRSFNLFSGQLSIEEYKTLTFPTYKAIAFVNKNTPENSRALLVGEAKSYYLKRPYYVSSGYDFSILKKYLEKSSNVNEFITALKADGIDFIIFNRWEFRRLQQDYNRLTREEFNQSLDFLQRLKAVFQEEGVFVFAINSPPPV